jgi:glycosyltransferase involved in cell wall biosynthesis
VARLHPIKNQAFLVDACAKLKARGVRILCLIAGEGPERAHLQRQIHGLGLEGQVKLLGHVPHEGVIRLLGAADLFALTSHSEGIPVAAMEAMAHGVPVLAPDMTGIPELVIDGKTGFLYRPGSLDSFIDRLEFIQNSFHALGPMRMAAHRHIAQHFNQQATLREFVDRLLEVIPAWRICNEDPVLQQVQLSV